MKRLLIGAGGTATAWHLVNLVNLHFSGRIEVCLCDTSPTHLLPASIYAVKTHQVPPVKDPGYQSHMLDLFSREAIDIYVPLVDQDVYSFTVDGDLAADTDVDFVSVTTETASIMQSKAGVSSFLAEVGVPVPETINPVNIESLSPDQMLFLKPASGFGSRGVCRTTVADAKSFVDDPRWLVQALCEGPEITVEVFNSCGIVKSLCRERLEVKAGVCTKARIWHDEKLQDLTKKLCGVMALPEAFCFQVMKNPLGEWVLIDLNPRLGAGTAMSTAVGWSLGAAALNSWCSFGDDPMEYINFLKGERFVNRVFQEIVMPPESLV
ncbi:MAG: ATP-grasp domain-containing protein [Methylococcales bacterium]|nr:ATP-grasp domain-containing protein [Methylococcales bacterium]